MCTYLPPPPPLLSFGVCICVCVCFKKIIYRYVNKYGLRDLADKHLLDLMRTSHHYARAEGDYQCAVLFRSHLEQSRLLPGETTVTDEHDLEFAFMLFAFDSLKNRHRDGHKRCMIQVGVKRTATTYPENNIF